MLMLGQRRAALEGAVQEAGDGEYEHFSVWVQGYSVKICRKLYFIWLHTKKSLCSHLSITGYDGENSRR